MNLIGGIVSLSIALVLLCALSGALITLTTIIARMMAAGAVAITALFPAADDQLYMDNRCPDCDGMESCTPDCPGSAPHDAAAAPSDTGQRGKGFNALSQFDRRQ